MSKSKRLMELMMAVNRKRKFTVKELAQEFGVSSRTMLRDLQELSELGVPLYSEVGPHGGYQVLRERVLPPIAFTEEEAVSVFFAVHALRHYSSLPFAAESSAALRKFYHYMPEETRGRIDQMKNRVDFVTAVRDIPAPHLADLLEAAIRQIVLKIDYHSRTERTQREIQPIGIFTRNGLWYCLAYALEKEETRVFRCDRIHAVNASDTIPLDLRHIHLANREEHGMNSDDKVQVYAELTRAGVMTCETDPWPFLALHTREDGSGWLEGNMSRNDLMFYARFFIGLGMDATVKEPEELLSCIQSSLTELMAKYSSNN